MKRFVSVMKFKEGADKQEYKRRHDNIWPELSDLMTRRGMKNYSIWLYEDLLFSYYETETGARGNLNRKGIQSWKSGGQSIWKISLNM